MKEWRIRHILKTNTHSSKAEEDHSGVPSAYPPLHKEEEWIRGLFDTGFV